MPIRSVFDDRERAICARLLEFRRLTGLSRVAFASKVGLDSALLSNYEHGRARLTYGVAWKILSRFPELNPKWLAVGDQNPPISLIPHVSIPVPGGDYCREKTPFSVAFDECIQPLISRASWAWNATPDGFHFTADANGRVCAMDWIMCLVQRLMELVPDDRFMPTVKAIVSALDKQMPDGISASESTNRREQMTKIIALRALTEKKTCKLTVDKYQKPNDSAGMSPNKSPLDSLIDRVRRVVNVRGKQAELAGRFGISRQAVTNWLKGKSDPSADIALRLLKWVEGEEAKQNNPGSATTPPGPKTRKGTARNEKS